MEWVAPSTAQKHVPNAPGKALHCSREHAVATPQGEPGYVAVLESLRTAALESNLICTMVCYQQFKYTIAVKLYSSCPWYERASARHTLLGGPHQPICVNEN